jgi:nicotinate-nucleotide pyrophosphorylase (carboxylating)
MAKSALVVAGLDVFAEAFRQLDPDVSLVVHHTDGTVCQPGTVVAVLEGRAAALITAERTALTFIQRLSGIATLTRRFVMAAEDRIIILDTRKTTPLLRALEKYAVRAGGADNHRFGLADAILIKDNHIRLAGGVENAVKRMRCWSGDRHVEVEAQSLDQVDAALRAGADIILLDNLSTEAIITAVERCAARETWTEISGGVTLERIPELAATGADYVSVGALTHSAPAADLSLEIEPLS